MLKSDCLNGINKNSVEDFTWSNVQKIVYEIWYEKSSDGWMTIYLKKHGKKYVLAAIEHFKTLDFVESAEAIGKTHTA